MILYSIGFRSLALSPSYFRAGVRSVSDFSVKKNALVALARKVFADSKTLLGGAQNDFPSGTTTIFRDVKRQYVFAFSEDKLSFSNQNKTPFGFEVASVTLSLVDGNLSDSSLFLFDSSCKTLISSSKVSDKDAIDLLNKFFICLKNDIEANTIEILKK